jgi:hypothetical protein
VKNIDRIILRNYLNADFDKRATDHLWANGVCYQPNLCFAALVCGLLEVRRRIVANLAGTQTRSKCTLPRPKPWVTVEHCTDIIYPAGQMYRLSSGIVHRVTPQQIPAATIVLTVTTKDAGHARVLIKGAINGHRRFDRSLLTAEDERRALDALNGFNGSSRAMR